MDTSADLSVATDRLLLRPFVADDLAAMTDMHARPDVARYLLWKPRDADASRAAFERFGLHRIVGRLDGRNAASAR